MDQENPAPIACDLNALRSEERARRSELAALVLSRAKAIDELPDGFAIRVDAGALASESFEWLLLERRCCPFLRLELEICGDGPLCVRLRGGPGVKEFLASAGLSRRPGAGA